MNDNISLGREYYLEKKSYWGITETLTHKKRRMFVGMGDGVTNALIYVIYNIRGHWVMYHTIRVNFH